MQTLNGSNLTQRMAGGRGQGRGTTNQGLHCTEAGTWPRGSAAHAGRSSGDSDEVAFTAARASRAEVDVEPLARTVIESTAEGPGNWYHRMVLVARRSKEWGFVFVPWFRHEQYRRTPVPGWEPSEAAVRLGDRFGLDIEQLAWRDYKLTDGGYSLRRFQYNYPSTPDDPFMAAGGMWFDAQLLADLYTSLLDRVEQAKEDLLILEPYDPRRRYVAGLDTSGGVGSDYAVLVILRDDRKVVLRWASNTTSPRGQADMAAQLCDVYGRCGLAVEVNKYGQYVLDVLDDDLMYPNLLKDPATGNWYRTTDTSKRAMYSDLRDVVDAGVADIGDPIMVMELQTIREFDDGRIEAAGKAHDDHADALAIANWAGRQEFAQASAERLRSERLERFKQR